MAVAEEAFSTREIDAYIVFLRHSLDGPVHATGRPWTGENLADPYPGLYLCCGHCLLVHSRAGSQIRVWLSVLVCVAVFLSRRYIFTALAKVDKILIAACRLCVTGRVGRRLFYLNLVRHRRYCGRRDVEPCVLIFGCNCSTSPINDQPGFLDSARCVAGQRGACSKSFACRELEPMVSF